MRSYHDFVFPPLSLQVCQAIDSSVGCGTASEADLAILLSGLEHEVVSIRDGCLRSLQTLVGFVDVDNHRYFECKTM